MHGTFSYRVAAGALSGVTKNFHLLMELLGTFHPVAEMASADTDMSTLETEVTSSFARQSVKPRTSSMMKLGGRPGLLCVLTSSGGFVTLQDMFATHHVSNSPGHPFRIFRMSSVSVHSCLARCYSVGESATPMMSKDFFIQP